MCLSHIENHPTILQADKRIAVSQLDETIRRKENLPNVGLNTDLGAQMGRTINPTTNTFENRALTYNYFQVDASWAVPDPLQQKLYSDYNSNQVDAAELSKEQQLLDLKIQTVQYFMSITLVEEQIAMTNEHLILLQKQLEIIDKAIEEGQLPRKNRIEITLNQTQSKQNLTRLYQDLNRHKSNIKFILAIPSQEVFEIEFNKELVDMNLQKLENTYQYSFNNYIPLKNKYNDIANAQLALDLLETERRPQISLFASIGTRYSSGSQEVIGLEEYMATQNVLIQGVETTIEAPQYNPIYSNISYFNQLKNNFGQNIGLRIGVPLWHKSLNQRKEQKQLEKELALTDLEQVKHLFDNEYTIAYQELNSQKEYINLAKERLALVQKRMEVNEQELALGANNILNLILTQRELESALNDYLIAKWTFEFNLTKFKIQFPIVKE